MIRVTALEFMTRADNVISKWSFSACSILEGGGPILPSRIYTVDLVPPNCTCPADNLPCKHLKAVARIANRALDSYESSGSTYTLVDTSLVSQSTQISNAINSIQVEQDQERARLAAIEGLGLSRHQRRSHFSTIVHRAVDDVRQMYVRADRAVSDALETLESSDLLLESHTPSMTGELMAFEI